MHDRKGGPKKGVLRVDYQQMLSNRDVLRGLEPPLRPL